MGSKKQGKKHSDKSAQSTQSTSEPNQGLLIYPIPQSRQGGSGRKRSRQGGHPGRTAFESTLE